MFCLEGMDWGHDRHRLKAMTWSLLNDPGMRCRSPEMFGQIGFAVLLYALVII